MDETGRTLSLRGINLSGSAKVPTSPNGATWRKDSLANHRDVSFVNRPLPLDETDEHFARLRAWGFTTIRLVITWEAIEHSEPGLYDTKYLDYLRELVKKADDYGMLVIIDPHQDVWSRFTGGDGAPGWTLELAGFDLANLHDVGAAFIHQHHGDPLPRMIWPANYNKLAAATMFTLFFAGRDFAPNFLVGGQNIQDFLQGHYIRAVQQVAVTLQDLPNVIGYEPMNEPSRGYIGEEDINRIPHAIEVKLGATPTILQSMALGAGIPTTVHVYKLGLTGFRKAGKHLINAEGVSAWQQPEKDIWQEQGVWQIGQDGKPKALIADYFSKVNGRKVDFYNKYYKPFINRYSECIRETSPNTLLLIERVPSDKGLTWSEDDPQNIVYADHWYDGITLSFKQFRDWLAADSELLKLQLGKKQARKSFFSQINRFKQRSVANFQNAPVLVGETGIPFDLSSKEAYQTGDFTEQVMALDATMSALEQNLVSFALWNYTPDNSNAHGDQWNDEDFSIYSHDQKTSTGSLDDGGRALRAFVRPYAMKTAGKPLSQSFDIKTQEYHFSFMSDRAISVPTEIFVPSLQYSEGLIISVSDGKYHYQPDKQLLLYFASHEMEKHSIRIIPTRIKPI